MLSNTEYGEGESQLEEDRERIAREKEAAREKENQKENVSDLQEAAAATPETVGSPSHEG
tara:strand:- start:335 stop:514 length:180 start_codon:yes stop_codon:yes gene_type:complete